MDQHPEPDQPISFIERYRGTPWDNSPPPPPPVSEEALRRARRLRLMLAGGALLVLVAVAGGVFVALQPRPPTGLAAFLAETPSPGGSAEAGSAATARPGEAASATPPSIAPVDQPWRTDPDHPASRFIERMGGADLSYHVQAVASVAAAGPPTRLAYSMDIAGDDWSLSVARWRPGELIRLETVVREGLYYARVDDGAWVRGTGGVPPGHVLGETGNDSYAGLQYLGEEVLDDRRLHHLRLPVRDWPVAAQRALGGLLVGPSVARWDVWVRKDGRPLWARLETDVAVRIGGRDLVLDVYFEYTFSKWGRPITIDAPAVD